MARPKKETQTDSLEIAADTTPQAETVMVVSKFERFVDLVMDVAITQKPTPVVMHPWLQAQVDAGLVILC